MSFPCRVPIHSGSIHLTSGMLLRKSSKTLSPTQSWRSTLQQQQSVSPSYPAYESDVAGKGSGEPSTDDGDAAVSGGVARVDSSAAGDGAPLSTLLLIDSLAVRFELVESIHSLE